MTIDSPTCHPDHDPAAQPVTAGDIYALLARTMRYPDAGTHNPVFFDALETLVGVLGWEKELASLQSWRTSAIDHLDDLRTEHTRLFITAAAPKRTIPPYASVHFDGSGSLCGKATERTRDFYRQYGYDLANEAEPADHLSLELDFLAALAEEEHREAEELFLRTLFRPWFERFRDKCVTEVRHPFFRASIRLIDFFTKEEL
jgi:TorA maturation chaperone TorD